MGKQLIVILDDHPLVAEGLRSVCVQNGSKDEVVCFTDIAPFKQFLQQHDPAMLLIDLKLKDTADGREKPICTPMYCAC